MSINLINLDLPAKLDEIFNFSFNFDGLKKIIEFFQKNNSIFIDSMKDFNKRMLTFESLKSDIEAIKIKSINIEKTNQEVINSYNNIKEKIISLDEKVFEFNNKLKENSEILIKEKYMLDNHEENINKLNIYVKENYESIKEIKENYYAIKKKVDVNSIKINELENKNNEAMNIIKSNSENINKEKLSWNHQMEMINSNINNINNSINNLKKISEIKFKDYDKNINDILNNISNPYQILSQPNSLEFAFMENIENKNKKNNNKDKNDNINNNVNFINEENKLYKILKLEIEKDKKKYNDLFEEYKLKEKNLKEENNINKKAIKDMQENIDNINMKLNNISNESNCNDNNINNNSNNNIIIENKISNNDFDYITTDKYKVLSDNIKILSVALNTKPNKEDLESLKRNIDLRLKKLEILQNNSFDTKKNKLIDFKEHKENTSLTDSKNIEYIIEKIQLSLNENLTPLIKDILLKNARNIDLSNNLVILEMIKNNQKYFDEFSKKFTTTIDKKYKLLRDLDDKVDSVNSEIIKLSENNNLNNRKIKELVKMIEGADNDDDQDEEDDDENKKVDKINKGAIKDRLLRLTDLYYEVRERIVLLEKKYASFSKEVKEDVKNNLKNETTKIVEQFKNKLSSFTYKFEDELRNKIDQIGLYTFEKRINTKLLYELKEKLDKNELKKSNTIMNRKIDSLENKISKTLVDTIIDLQMDEAPLIAKKNNKNIEICASCNQILKRNNSIDSDCNLSQNRTYMNKFKIKNTKYNANNTQNIMAKNDLYSPKKYLPEINSSNIKDK